MSPNTYSLNVNDTSELGRSFKSLFHEVQIPGLIELKKSLENNTRSIEQIRSDNVLIQSLVGIIPEAAHNYSWIIFDINEIKDEEKNSLLEVSKSPNIESVAAQMLLAIAEKDMTPDKLKDKLSEVIKGYKDKLMEQVNKDSSRTAQLIKTDDKVAFIDNIDSLGFSGEQKEFLKIALHQATFGLGWIGASTEKISNEMAKIDGGVNYNARYPMLIDCSNNVVKLYSAVDIRTSHSDESFKQHSKITLEVDISQLRGDEYNPCITDKPVSITAIVTELDKSLSFDLTNKDKVEDKMHGYVRDICMDAELNTLNSTLEAQGKYKGSVMYDIFNNQLHFGDNFAKMVDAVIRSKEPEKTKEAKLTILKEMITPEKIVCDQEQGAYVVNTQAYVSIEDDQDKRKNFAEKQLNNAKKSPLLDYIVMELTEEKITKGVHKGFVPLDINDNYLNNPKEQNKINLDQESLKNYSEESVKNKDPEVTVFNNQFEVKEKFYETELRQKESQNTIKGIVAKGKPISYVESVIKDKEKQESARGRK
jgi:hypothetical protein